MKPGKDKETGDLIRLHKRIRVKVIVGSKTVVHQFVAPPQRGYTEADVEETLSKVVDYLDRKFINIEFKHVPLLPNVHNFIAIGTRGVVAVNKPEPDAQKVIDQIEKEERDEADGSKPNENIGVDDLPDGGTPDRAARSVEEVAG